MTQTGPVDYYRILKVKSSATGEQLRAAYLSLAKEQHPDRGGSLQAMRRLNQAYETLRDPSKRAEYDAWYRNYKVDKRLGLDDDLDIEEVDEFLREVYVAERRQRWMSPFMVGLSVAIAVVLVFVVFEVGHMLTTSDTAQAAPVVADQKAKQ